MRRFPASWNGTRTKLGWKRFLRTGGRSRRSQHRRLPLEPLEDRRVLAAMFEITGGAGAEFFQVDTVEQPGSEGPQAVLRVADGADLPVRMRQEVELSFVDDGVVVSTQDVWVTLPGRHVLNSLRSHRRERAAGLATTLEAADLAAVVEQLGADGTFADIEAERAILATRYSEVPPEFQPGGIFEDLEYDAETMRRAASHRLSEEALDRLGLLAREIGTRPRPGTVGVELTGEHRLRLYQGLVRVAADLGIDASDEEALADRRGPYAERLGAIVTFLWDVLLVDSIDVSVTYIDAAAAARNLLRDHADVYHTVWTG